MSNRKVLLIGLGGADWNAISPLLEAGKLPALAKLVEGGCSGKVATLFPTVAPQVWTSIATGKRANKHGVHGFTEVDPNAHRVVPTSAGSRNCRAIWEMLSAEGIHSNAVGWFAGHPAEPVSGVSVSNFFGEAAPPTLDEPWPLLDGCVSPSTATDRLVEAQVHPLEIERETVQLMMPNLDEACDEDRALIARVVGELAKAYSIYTVTLEILKSEPWQFVASCFRHFDIICRSFMPFVPPRMHGVDERRVHLFGDVVENSLRFFDLLLAGLVGQAGEDATIIVLSDHGYLSGTERPPADSDFETWHRSHGMLIARGPGIQPDELIHGAGLLDIAPTILTLFGRPTGADMDGRVLTELFDETPELTTIESWEPKSSSDHPPCEFADSYADAALDLFTRLGYIAPLDKDNDRAIEQTLRQNQ